jgi:thymidylate synthase (FAD)
MKIIDQSWQWITKPTAALQTIVTAGRTCYKSESKSGVSVEEQENFVRRLIRRGHESVIEHAFATVRFITNRGVTHELVRHRLASFSQESTRYVRYDGNMEFIRPVWWDQWNHAERECWKHSMGQSEDAYRRLLKAGSRPEQAREVLPNSLKTEIVMTANLREWRHVFKLRCSLAAHPQIRELMMDCLAGFKAEVPAVFDDIYHHQECNQQYKITADMSAADMKIYEHIQTAAIGYQHE